MGSPPPPQGGHGPRWRRIIVTVAVLGIAFLILARTRFSKDVTFEGTCASLPVTSPLTIDVLKSAATVLTSVETVGFGGKAMAAAIAFDPTGKGDPAPVSGKAFEVQGNSGATRSQLTVDRLQAPLGKLQIEIRRDGVLKSVGAGGGPQLVLEDATSGGATLTISATQLRITGYACRLPGLSERSSPQDAFRIDMTAGGLALAPGGQAGATATLQFKPRTGPVPLGIASPGGATSGSGPLVAGGCVNPDIRADGKPVAGIIKDAPADFEVGSGSASLDELSIVPDPKSYGSPTLHIKGHAHTSHLKQAGQELLPAMLGEAADDPWSRGVILLVVAGMAQFAAKYVDELIAKLVKLLQ